MRYSELREAGAQTLYHVTDAKNIPSIQKKGLLMMQTSQWVKAGDKERYGSGEIYAFENITDAYRWAAKMDWMKNKALGTGKVSIIKFHDSDVWKQDNNDPLGQAARAGRWLKKVGKVPPENIIEILPFNKADVQKAILK
jgi:hypothetical protein